MTQPYQSDIDFILSKQFDNGADLWATPDKRIGKGGVFSTLACARMLAELGIADTPIMKETAELLFSLWREDGRFQIAPNSSIYPCQTAHTASTLCHMGHSSDSRLTKTVDHFLKIQHTDGGWRCNSFKYGRGPETEFSNPGTTLDVLDFFRFTSFLNNDERLDHAVEFLLSHWVTRAPLGPCHYGMGTLFMKVEFPFFRYNLFYYVYVLSFYEKAKKDDRFLEAFEVLQSKLVNGKMVVENPNAKISHLSFCKKREPSELATQRFEEIINNLS